jgi:hypothetical protein
MIVEVVQTIRVRIHVSEDILAGELDCDIHELEPGDYEERARECLEDSIDKIVTQNPFSHKRAIAIRLDVESSMEKVLWQGE